MGTEFPDDMNGTSPTYKQPRWGGPCGAAAAADVACARGAALTYRPI